MARREVIAAGLLSLFAATLAACNEEEARQPLSYEPGVYQGQRDTGISGETRAALAKRVELQRF